MSDYFISYTSSDRDWAHWIAKELEALGHTPHVHEWEIKGGDDIYAWMEMRHDAADHVLCVVSDEYLKAPYLDAGAQRRDVAGGRASGRASSCSSPSSRAGCRRSADHIRRCELFGVPEDARARPLPRFHERKPSSPMRSRSPARCSRSPTSRSGCRRTSWDVTRNSPRSRRRSAGYEGRVAITALHGLRGVGKTTLAAAMPSGIAVIIARPGGSGRRPSRPCGPTWSALGVRLGWVAADDKEEPALAAVMERLRHEGEGVLLIFDNAVDARCAQALSAARRRARVLVTSNAHAWRGIAEPVEIRLWPKEIGADYLFARTGARRERDAAEALSEALGGLPLAHEQAAAYCERLEISLAEYRRRFDAAPARLLDDAARCAGRVSRRLTVAKTFALAIEEAAKLHPAAEPLIVHAALLAPEPIPLFLFPERARSWASRLLLCSPRTVSTRRSRRLRVIRAGRPRDDRG